MEVILQSRFGTDLNKKTNTEIGLVRKFATFILSQNITARKKGLREEQLVNSD